LAKKLKKRGDDSDESDSEGNLPVSQQIVTGEAQKEASDSDEPKEPLKSEEINGFDPRMVSVAPKKKVFPKPEGEEMIPHYDHCVLCNYNLPCNDHNHIT